MVGQVKTQRRWGQDDKRNRRALSPDDVNSLTRRKPKNVKEHADQNIRESIPELGTDRMR